jgi:hypothetical protein
MDHNQIAYTFRTILQRRGLAYEGWDFTIYTFAELFSGVDEDLLPMINLTIDIFMGRQR